MVRGKLIAAVAATMGIATLGLALFAVRDRLLEEWQLRRLQSGDPQTVRDAAESLGRMGSIRAMPHLVESISKRTIHIFSKADRESLLKLAERHQFDCHVNALFAIARAHPEESTACLLGTNAPRGQYLYLLAKEILTEAGVDWKDALLRRQDGLFGQSTWVPVSDKGAQPAVE